MILDSANKGPEHSLAVAEKVLDAGCRFIQVREKSMNDRDRLLLLRRLIDRAKRLDAWVVMNDRVDLAILASANGVHLGQDDITMADARNLIAGRLSAAFIVGQSVGSKDEALLAQSNGADYLGCGAVFTTGTKEDAVEIGLERLTTIANSVNIPVFGIGGISVERVADVLSAGALGVAVCSAIMSSPDPARATRDFIAAISSASCKEQG